MRRLIAQSVSRKLMLVVFATTFLALLAYGTTMLVYDLRSYHSAVTKDLATQANIIAEVSAPALEFNDPQVARENLALLRTRPSILQAAIYTAAGERFADYVSQDGHLPDFLMIPLAPGDYMIEDNRITVSRRIVKDRTLLGTVYIRARYEANERAVNYAMVLAYVMIGSLALATLIFWWLQRVVTKPIFSVTNVARDVMQKRDYSLRAEKYTGDEIGILVDAFNGMLAEVERRASALEASNESLAHEMNVRRAAENALRLADRRKDEFLATLAHELRNPLAPLVNGLKILRLSPDNADARDKAQDIMERQLRQMVRLVDDLLDVSRITTGKLTVSKNRVDVQSVMRAALESSGAIIDIFGHKLDVRMPEQTVYVDADAVRLAQVFSNLLNNAAKYTNPGGHILFAAKAHGAEVVVEVTDNGIGIAPDMLPQIFDMFTQVDYSLERTQAGLGVGLALSKRLVELHGGTIEARSAGIGRGSTFIVRLPVAMATEVPVQVDVDAEQNVSGCCRILLVDDNVDFVTTMSTLLTGLGHDVRTAHDGNTALTVAKEFAPAFAFLDIGMPGLNGYDLARRMRDMTQTVNSVLVAVTGWGQEKDRQESSAAGFDYHLVKPVDLAQILGVLREKSGGGDGRPD